MTANLAPQIYNVATGETRNISVDFQGLLDSGELLTGTPTVTEVTTADLTLASKAVSTAALTINGVTAAIGEAVTFSVTGVQAAKIYSILITATTTSTPAQTVQGTVRVKGVAAS